MAKGNCIWFGILTVASDLIARLRPCPPQYMRAGSMLTLSTLVTTGPESKIATRLKIRDREQPVAGEVYRARVRVETPQEFVDARTGIKCRSRENLTWWLYPYEGTEEPVGELRFFTCAKGSEPIIRPAPVFLAKTDGVHERGVWWIAAPGVDYDVTSTAPSDTVLFSGNVLVQLGGLPERVMPGSVKIDIADRVSVYDRRKDRMSSFARAEYIRRTINNGRAHSFEFINLRDVATGGVVQSGGPEAVLTVQGLNPVEEG